MNGLTIELRTDPSQWIRVERRDPRTGECTVNRFVLPVLVLVRDGQVVRQWRIRTWPRLPWL